MFRAWYVVLLVLTLGVAGCAELDPGSRELDTLTPAAEEQPDAAEVTTEGTDQHPSSDDSAYDDVKEELGEAGKAIQDLGSEQKDKFVQEIDKQLKELDASIAELRERAKDAKEDARKESEERLADIETKRQALLDRLEELGRASGNAWEDFREGVTNAWEELRKARDDASSGSEAKVGGGVDVKVGDDLKIDVEKNGTMVEISPGENSKEE